MKSLASNPQVRLPDGTGLLLKAGLVDIDATPWGKTQPRNSKNDDVQKRSPFPRGPFSGSIIRVFKRRQFWERSVGIQLCIVSEGMQFGSCARNASDT